jgi:LemA protein
MKYLAIVAAVLLVVGGVMYNGMMGKDEDVKKAWGDVQSQYQRRTELFENLVSVVKGAKEYEKDVLTSVTEARANATKLTMNPDDLTPEKLKQLEASSAQIGGVMSRLLMITEKYPDLKAIDNYKDMQAEVSGTQNRVTRSRDLYNEAVQTYNKGVRSFPTNLVASVLGFKKRASFEGDAASQKNPSLDKLNEN